MTSLPSDAAADAQPSGSVVTSRLRSTWAERAIPAGAGLTFVRVVLGVVGLGGLALAAYVTYDARDGTATAALIGASVVMLFLAAFGHLIKSFKYGEVEMLLRQAKAADELGDDEARDAFVGAALNAAGVSRGLADDIEVTSRSWLYRNEVLNALTEVASPDVEVKYIERPVRGLAIAGDTTIGVHMRSGVKQVAQLEERLLRKKLRAEHRRLGGLLLAIRKQTPAGDLAGAETRLRDGLGIPVRVMYWESGSPPQALGNALAELLAEARAAPGESRSP